MRNVAAAPWVEADSRSGLFGKLERAGAARLDEEGIDRVHGLERPAQSRGCLRALADRDRGDAPPTPRRDRGTDRHDDRLDTLLHTADERIAVDTTADDGDAIADGDAVLGQQGACASRHHARQIVAGEGDRAVVGARGEDQRPWSDDDGLVLSDDENLALVDADRGCAAVKMQAGKIWNRLTARPERASRSDAVIHDGESEDRSGALDEPAGEVQARCAGAHDERIDLFA